MVVLLAGRVRAVAARGVRGRRLALHRVPHPVIAPPARLPAGWSWGCPQRRELVDEHRRRVTAAERMARWERCLTTPDATSPAGSRIRPRGRLVWRSRWRCCGRGWHARGHRLRATPTRARRRPAGVAAGCGPDRGAAAEGAGPALARRCAGRTRPLCQRRRSRRRRHRAGGCRARDSGRAERGRWRGRGGRGGGEPAAGGWWVDVGTGSRGGCSPAAAWSPGRPLCRRRCGSVSRRPVSWWSRAGRSAAVCTP